MNLFLQKVESQPKFSTQKNKVKLYYGTVQMLAAKSLTRARQAKRKNLKFSDLEEVGDASIRM